MVQGGLTPPRLKQDQINIHITPSAKLISNCLGWHSHHCTHCDGDGDGGVDVPQRQNH